MTDMTEILYTNVFLWAVPSLSSFLLSPLFTFLPVSCLSPLTTHHISIWLLHFLSCFILPPRPSLAHFRPAAKAFQFAFAPLCLCALHVLCANSAFISYNFQLNPDQVTQTTVDVKIILKNVVLCPLRGKNRFIYFLFIFLN